MGKVAYGPNSLLSKTSSSGSSLPLVCSSQANESVIHHDEDIDEDEDDEDDKSSILSVSSNNNKDENLIKNTSTKSVNSFLSLVS